MKSNGQQKGWITMSAIKIKIKGVELAMDEYQANFLTDKEGKVLSISFPIESFYDFVEDVEDISFLDGYDTPDSDKESIPHEEIMKEFGLTPERIKRIRTEMGLTQEQFGKKIGYAAGTIRNIETGQNKITPRVEKAIEALQG
jgi:DNA-binding XRE family transcriptional regulator